MHHDPAHVTGFLIGVAAGVVLTAILAVIRVQVQRRIFAGPRLDAWQQARRQLGWAGQWRVIWATQFSHLTSRAALAHAQLAYARYLQDAARREIEKQSRPGLRRGRWLAAAAGFGLAATGWWAAAATPGQGPEEVVAFAAAAWLMFSALYTALALPRSWRRLMKRMARLQAKIEDRSAILQTTGQDANSAQRRARCVPDRPRIPRNHGHWRVERHRY